MGLWINNDLCEYVKECVWERWPEKRVEKSCRPRSWQSSRFIQVTTYLKDISIHYEYYDGKIQLHFEGKYTGPEYKSFRQFLTESQPSDGEIQWRQWNGLKQGLCEHNVIPETWEDIIDSLSYMIDRFDPLIQQYVDENRELFPEQFVVKPVPKLSYKLKASSGSALNQPSIKTIREIPFNVLSIPTYQRPYKWTPKNVNQLITDLLAFRNARQYRLGTLVLHNNEIVDGQQRIVTLALLLTFMYNKMKDGKKKDGYHDFFAQIEAFCSNTEFSNRYSLHNVVENIHVIEARENDLDDELVDFILNKCEFVVIDLNDISEAFQFFDSQNARGKDLEAHDLLKAYHLREIPDMSETDSANIDCWQSQKTEYLKDVFLSLFRAKRWAQGKSARFFTKNHTDVFKGISLKDGKRYPFYQMEVIAHIFSQIYSSDPLRIIDQNRIEYPFNLDDQIINGSRFFDMLRHYLNLYHDIQERSFYPEGGRSEEIMVLINDYDGMWRTGDQYIRNMFFTLVLYYVDRFGKEELDKVIPKFFIWAFTLRLKSPAVQLASTDNYATMGDSLFRLVHEAKTPYDIINASQDSLSANDIKCTKCEGIQQMFVSLKKIYNV